MAENSKPKSGEGFQRLFIKVIMPKQGSERKVPGGGNAPKPFRVVDENFRKSISIRINSISSVIRPLASKLPSVPIRVKLISKAIAKSNQPITLFSDDTCPIIGAGKQGEIYLKATESGLSKIDRLILRNTSEKIIKEISTIETIDLVTPKERLFGFEPEEILKNSPKTKTGFLAKVQIFDLKNDGEQKFLFSDFKRQCDQAQISFSKKGYSDKSDYYEVILKKTDDVRLLSNIVGVRSIKSMPIIKSIRALELGENPLPASLPTPSTGLNSYPIVAIVDTGVSDKIPKLNQWVVARKSTVAAPYRNAWHGTFVAGLVCWGKELNPGMPEIDLNPCQIFDMQAIPNDDPSKGDVDSITESELLHDLEIVLKEHANTIKVWNISLGTNEVCSLDSFSSFAVEMDRLQEKYNVTFVISAGNYSSFPLLNYPRNTQEIESGRITSPADSILGITVGSAAHVTHITNGPKKGEPSSFSRHGAGPNYIIKPDLVHYGGTCSRDNAERHGISSISGEKIGESFGTSFSAPLVSRLLANIYHQINPAPSPILARALLTHHSRDPRTKGRVPDREENYLGFGMPSTLNECLECHPWSSTLVFEDELRPGYYLEWDNFPFPKSLIRNGKYFGEIWMTLAFAPSLDEDWGSEYCETHIDAKFGVYRTKKDKKTGQPKEEFTGLVPPEHKNPGLLYESYQIERLRKWAPVRTYHGDLNGGESGNRWRLKVQLLSRHGIDKSFRPQKFALILTIADPSKKEDVYNEMSVGILNKFKAQNLSLRVSTQLQT